MEIVFVLCQYMTKDNIAEMRRAKVFSKVSICESNNCVDGYKVLFDGDKKTIDIYESSCYIDLKEIK